MKWREWAKVQNLKQLKDKSYNFPYHPQCDGGVELLFRKVTSVISKIAKEQEEWDQHLPKVLLA